MTPVTLTRRQCQVLDAIVRLTRPGQPPTIRQLGAALGITSPHGVICHLKAIQKKGFLDWQFNRARTLVVPRLPCAV